MKRVLLSILAAFLISMPALAGALGDAKKAGQIREKPDGYVALADSSAPANIKQLVTDTNAERRKVYEDIAKKEGISVEAVAARSGQRLINE